MSEPISNPNVSPGQPVPPVGPGKPGLGSEEQTQQKPFSVGPEKEQVQTQPGAQKPSPLSVAADTARQQQQMPPEDLADHISKLQQNLSNAQTQLQNPQVAKKMTAAHQEALQKLTDKMDPDMQSIAKYTNGTHEAAKKVQSPLEHVLKWINSSQGTLGHALNYLQTQNQENPNPASYLRLQYAVQRATQRGELFSSIIGSSVSGIKTIMSTQLG